MRFFSNLYDKNQALGRIRAQFRCRLCWRVTLAVFVSIFVIEAAILVPSYLSYEQKNLLQLDQMGHTAIEAAFASHRHTSVGELLNHGGEWIANTKLRGGALYYPDGAPIGTFGEKPENTLAMLLRQGPQRVASGLYEVVWKITSGDIPVTMVALLDASAIAGEMSDYLIRIGGLVLLISVFVCAISMLILGRSVLMPLLDIRTSLVGAQQDPANADSFMLPENRSDEIGEVAAALNQMLRRLSKAQGEELAMMSAMVENSTQGFVVHDSHGSTVFANPACLEFCGVDHLRELDEQGLPKFTRSDRDKIESVIEIAGHGLFSGEAMLHESSGAPMPCYVDVSRADNAEGEAIRYYALITDFTDLAQTRRRLEQKNEELQSADQAKSQFLANMSHELRTPLNAVIGFAEVMRTELFGNLGNEGYKEYADDIHSSGQHLLQIINNILDLSKIEAGHMELNEEPVDLAEAINSGIKLVREQAKQHRIDMTTEIPRSLPRLSADHQKLNQILINILTNSVKYTGDGG